MYNLFIFCFFYFTVVSTNNTEKLVKELLESYIKIAPPAVPTKVTVGLLINDVVEVNERRETITIIEWRGFYWSDPRLTWNPEDYGNLEAISIPHHYIWKPDLRLYYVVSRAEIIQDIDTVNIRVTHTGRLTLMQPEISQVRCKLDVTLLPFDTQRCKLQYESWSYDSSELELELADWSLSLNAKQSFHEWTVTDTMANKTRATYFKENKNSSISFDNVVFYLTFKRSPAYYVYVILMPSFIITTVCILGIFSPFNPNGDREEKVSLGITTLLTMTVMLQLVADSVPRSSHGLPLLGKYILFELALSAFATCSSIMTMYLNQRALYREWNAPRWLLHLVCIERTAVLDLKMKISRTPNCKTGCLLPKDFVAINGKDLYSTMAQIRYCVQEIKDILEKKKKTERRQRLWNLILGRVDDGLLIIFLLINISVTVAIFTPVIL